MIAAETLILRNEELGPRTELSATAVRNVSGALNALLADMFALYLTTKKFKWHVSGRHFRYYHLLLEEQANQIFLTTDSIADRVRKIGGRTLCSIGQIAAEKRLLDNDTSHVDPLDMLAELREDNDQLTNAMRRAKWLCDEHDDDATASLLEVWIGEAKLRVWFLLEATRITEV